jgi:hypothetical protein
MLQAPLGRVTTATSWLGRRRNWLDRRGMRGRNPDESPWCRTSARGHRAAARLGEPRDRERPGGGGDLSNVLAVEFGNPHATSASRPQTRRPRCERGVGRLRRRSQTLFSLSHGDPRGRSRRSHRQRGVRPARHITRPREPAAEQPLQLPRRRGLTSALKRGRY